MFKNIFYLRIVETTNILCESKSKIEYFLNWKDLNFNPL